MLLCRFFTSLFLGAGNTSGFIQIVPFLSAPLLCLSYLLTRNKCTVYRCGCFYPPIPCSFDSWSCWARYKYGTLWETREPNTNTDKREMAVLRPRWLVYVCDVVLGRFEEWSWEVIDLNSTARFLAEGYWQFWGLEDILVVDSCCWVDSKRGGGNVNGWHRCWRNTICFLESCYCFRERSLLPIN
jgi:hypothetical protein